MRSPYLVGLNGSHLFILLDKVSDLFHPLLQCSLRDGLRHLRNLDGFG